MTPRDASVVRGKHPKTRGNVGVGEPGPTPNRCYNDAARRHWVQLPDLKDTFHEGGLELLEKPPTPTPCPSELLLCQRRGISRSVACPSLRVVLNNRSKKFPTPFHRHCPTPSLPCPTPPRNLLLRHALKHNVAVPINKVEGRLRGAYPSGVGGEIARHPFGGGGGAGSGSVRRGGSLEMKGGTRGAPESLQRSGAVESWVGDVRDMNFWLDSGMERGHAPILPPPWVGKVPGEGKKRMVR